MKITITEKNENKLLNRVEVKGNLEFDKDTPSNAQLAEVLAKELKTKSDLVIVKSIYTKFGKQNADFFALVYENQEAKDKIEMNTKHLKKKSAEVAKKAEEEKAAAAETKQKEAEEKAKAAEEAKQEAETAGSETSEAPEAKPQSEPVEEKKEEEAKPEEAPEVKEEPKEEEKKPAEKEPAKESE